MQQPSALLSLLVLCVAGAAHAGMVYVPGPGTLGGSNHEVQVPVSNTVGSGSADLPSADLSVTKVDTPDPVTAGTNLTYTITVVNGGPSNAPSASLSDTLPADASFVSLGFPGDWSCITPVGAGVTVTCTNPSMPPGSALFTLTVQVGSTVPAGTVLSNTATVAAAASDPSPGNNSATATTTVEAGSADLSVTKVDTPDPVVPGGNITYTITVTNAGPSNVEVILSDLIPADTRQIELTSPPDWSCLAPTIGAVTCSNPSFGVGNGSAVFTMTIETPPSLTTGAVVTNTASVTSSTADPNPGNNSASATTTVAANPGGVSLIMIDFPDQVVASTGMTYFIKLRNSSGATLGSATFTDPLPAGTTFLSLEGPSYGIDPAPGWTCSTPAVGFPGTVTCSGPSLLPGDTSLDVNVNVNASVPAGTVLTNTANLAVMDGASTLNRTATTTTTVFTPGTIVSGTKTASGGAHIPGTPVTYTVVLTNYGDAPQGDNPSNEFTDVLPAGLTLVGATATSGTATANVATRTVTWNGSIPAGSSVTITIQAMIDANVAPGTTLSNQATFAYDPDGDGTNVAMGMTDDPAGPGAAEPTAFVVAGGPAPGPANIPTLGEIGLALLVLLLGLGGAVMVRERGPGG